MPRRNRLLRIIGDPLWPCSPGVPDDHCEHGTASRVRLRVLRRLQFAVGDRVEHPRHVVNEWIQGRLRHA